MRLVNGTERLCLSVTGAEGGEGGGFGGGLGGGEGTGQSGLENPKPKGQSTPFVVLSSPSRFAFVRLFSFVVPFVCTFVRSFVPRSGTYKKAGVGLH